jgi:hypothetical protein
MRKIKILGKIKRSNGEIGGDFKEMGALTDVSARLY